MAVRMKVLGARGIVADGRVRDLETLGSLGLPVSGLLYEASNGGAYALPRETQRVTGLQNTWLKGMSKKTLPGRI